MENSQRPMFGAAIGALMELHGKQPSEAMLDLYWESLKHLEASEFKAAIGEVVRSSKFMPKPSEILEVIEGPRKNTAAMQWAHVRRTMDFGDIYCSPDFGRVVNAVLHALGGWEVLCEKTIPELVWYQKDFERIYADFESKDLSSMRIEGHVGNFGKAPTWCALPGTPKAPLQIESAGRHDVSDFVRKLADDKSLRRDDEQEQQLAEGKS